MAVHPRFAVASKTAEISLNTVGAAHDLWVEGNHDEARKGLRCVGAFARTETGLPDAISAMGPALHRVAHRIVLNGPNGSSSHASAHEAIAFLWNAASIFADHPEPAPIANLLSIFDHYTVSTLRVELLHERAKLAAEAEDRASAAPAATAAPLEPSAAAYGRGEAKPVAVSGQAIEGLLGKEAQQILDVARSKAPAEMKMRAVCRIDERHWHWKSTQWADLLGISDAAVRQTRFWKEDRAEHVAKARRNVPGE